jgi:hypothetical protein
MSHQPAPKPPLSIIVACREPWPAIRVALDALHPQVVAMNAEIIVAMNDPATVAPDGKELYPAVRWLQGARDDSVFRLRAFALPQCRADIIALTEDHARVDTNWCGAILQAHAQYPEAAAIGGVVENGATESIADWAAFLIINGRFMRPIRNGPSREISLQSNVSYKRSALPGSFPQFGLVTSTLHHELHEGGAMLVASDRMVVHHAQKLTLGSHSALHFHNARSTAGLLRIAAPASPWLAGYAVMLPKLVWRTVATGLRKRRHRRELIMGFPLIVWLVGCHAAGELIGHFMGPGDSPRRVN